MTDDCDAVAREARRAAATEVERFNETVRRKVEAKGHAMNDAEKVRRAVDEGCLVGDPAEVASLLAAEVRRLRPEAPPPRTVRVRVAVAVESGGEWFAYGASGVMPETAAYRAEHGIFPVCRVSWVEADVPLPAAPVVRGEVAGGGDHHTNHDKDHDR